MRIVKFVCPAKFMFARRDLKGEGLKILDIGCGNNSPTVTKHWFPGSYYSGADIEDYNNTAADYSTMDIFYPLGYDGSGYEAIPDGEFDFIIINHVVEHMPDPNPILTKICSKLKPGGYIWIAFPSLRSLSLPSGTGCLQFCDDDTHVRLPDVREITNLLLTNDIKVTHAGHSRPVARVLLGAMVLPFVLLGKLFTGKLSAGGKIWYILGFEDHVYGHRRINK